MSAKKIHMDMFALVCVWFCGCNNEVKQDLGFDLEFVDIAFEEDSVLRDPLERYELDYEFQIMSREITQEQFELVLGYRCQAGKDSSFLDIGQAAAYFVSWNMAAHFANQWSTYNDVETCYTCSGFTVDVECTPREDIAIEACAGFRLPTETEWELAARSGTKRAFWTGQGDWLGGNYDSNECDGESIITDTADNPLLSNWAWYCGNNDEDGPKEVGLLNPNGYGLYDIHGNVWEWMHSGDGAPYSEFDPNDPNRTEKVLRGGGFHNNPYDITLSYRSSYAPNKRLSGYGFRLARSIR